VESSAHSKKAAKTQQNGFQSPGKRLLQTR
jgi:hypothetical protein